MRAGCSAGREPSPAPTRPAPSAPPRPAAEMTVGTARDVVVAGKKTDEEADQRPRSAR
jgi:hypothetical protein